jgi:hypothetical protein
LRLVPLQLFASMPHQVRNVKIVRQGHAQPESLSRHISWGKLAACAGTWS